MRECGRPAAGSEGWDKNFQLSGVSGTKAGLDGFVWSHFSLAGAAQLLETWLELEVSPGWMYIGVVPPDKAGPPLGAAHQVSAKCLGGHSQTDDIDISLCLFWL